MQLLAMTSERMLHHRARDPTLQPVAMQQLIRVWKLLRRAATLHKVLNEIRRERPHECCAKRS